MKTSLALLLMALAVFNVACEGCMRRVPVELVELADWPACARAAADEVLVARELASGPTMLEKTVVERYSIARHGDCFVGRVHLSWKLGETALEVVWDRDLLPIAAYKRMGYPGDASLFEERGYRVSESEAVMVRATPDDVERFRLRGERPTVVVPTGRGLFSVAFMRALELSVGESKKETAIDLRRLVERIEPASVRRDPAREGGHTPRAPSTFTFMGRDTIFVDEDGFVIGDMAGLEVTDAELSDAFEGVAPAIDAAGAWRRLRAAGLDLR